ncbi:MAG: hypothetical protein ACI4P0_03365 [Mailhella sp.]
MKTTISSILAHWGMENCSPVKDSGSGAAIAAGVWHISEEYSLKTGNNFEGLKKHIDISKVLHRNGITASCPLPTLDGQDFITVGDHYYVITERVMDNFLSTSVSDPANDDKRFAMYAREIKNFENAMARGEKDLMRILNWADAEAERMAKEKGVAFAGEIHDWCRQDALRSLPREGYVCATKYRMTIDALISRLNVKEREHIAVKMLHLFAAWTDGRSIFDELIKGNLHTAVLLTKIAIL